MPNKFVGAFKFLTQGERKGKVATTITKPRQLKTTMKKIQSENKRFGFTKAKTATDRANIVRRKKSIERMDKLEKAKSKVKTGEKGKKEIQNDRGHVPVFDRERLAGEPPRVAPEYDDGADEPDGEDAWQLTGR